MELDKSKGYRAECKKMIPLSSLFIDLCQYNDASHP